MLRVALARSYAGQRAFQGFARYNIPSITCRKAATSRVPAHLGSFGYERDDSRSNFKKQTRNLSLGSVWGRNVLAEDQQQSPDEPQAPEAINVSTELGVDSPVDLSSVADSVPATPLDQIDGLFSILLHPVLGAESAMVKMHESKLPSSSPSPH